MKFKGSFTALITPFNEDFSVNYDKLAQLVDFQIKSKTDGLVVLGTTAETPTLNAQEKKKIVDVVIQVNQKRVPIMVGTGTNNTAQTIEDSKLMETLKVDSLLVVTPYYNKSNAEGLFKHYEIVAQSVNLPIVLYNVPSRTGVQIPIPVIERLIKIKNICGIKEASGDMSYIMKVANLLHNSFELISGNDDVILPVLAVGGSGVISVASNIIPQEIHELTEYFHTGNLDKAKKIQLQLLNFMNALFLEVNPIPVKEAMNMRGMEVGPCRMPLYKMSEEAKLLLKKAINL